MGERRFKIPGDVVRTLCSWNNDPEKVMADFDKRFVHVLLLSLADVNQIANDKIPIEVMEFIKGINENSV